MSDAGRRLGESMAVRGELARATICDLEVGYCARDAPEWDRLVGVLDAFAVVETSAGRGRRALQVQRLLAGRSHGGRKIPISSSPRPPRSGT